MPPATPRPLPVLLALACCGVLAQVGCDASLSRLADLGDLRGQPGSDMPQCTPEPVQPAALPFIHPCPAGAPCNVPCDLGVPGASLEAAIGQNRPSRAVVVYQESLSVAISEGRYEARTWVRQGPIGAVDVPVRQLLLNRPGSGDAYMTVPPQEVTIPVGLSPTAPDPHPGFVIRLQLGCSGRGTHAWIVSNPTLRIEFDPQVRAAGSPP